jgi:hypothetical protein
MLLPRMRIPTWHWHRPKMNEWHVLNQWHDTRTRPKRRKTTGYSRRETTRSESWYITHYLETLSKSKIWNDTQVGEIKKMRNNKIWITLSARWIYICIYICIYTYIYNTWALDWKSLGKGLKFLQEPVHATHSQRNFREGCGQGFDVLDLCHQLLYACLV